MTYKIVEMLNSLADECEKADLSTEGRPDRIVRIENPRSLSGDFRSAASLIQEMGEALEKIENDDWYWSRDGAGNACKAPGTYAKAARSILSKLKET